MEKLTVLENGLLPIYKGKSENDELISVVNARELHEFLEVGTKFADWIKNRIEKYEFIENEDFLVSEITEVRNVGATTKTEYFLKMDTAKEIAMVENNFKGSQARKYFIEVEKKFKTGGYVPQVSQAELTAMIAQNQVEIERTANTALEIANKASRQIKDALDVFSAAIEPSWRDEMNSKLNSMIQANGLNYRTFKGALYTELDNLAHVNISIRQTYRRNRMQNGGSTVAECKAITKLDIIERNPKLKPIFEGIVRKYQAKYVVGV